MAQSWHSYLSSFPFKMGKREGRVGDTRGGLIWFWKDFCFLILVGHEHLGDNVCLTKQDVEGVFFWQTQTRISQPCATDNSLLWGLSCAW